MRAAILRLTTNREPYCGTVMKGRCFTFLVEQSVE